MSVWRYQIRCEHFLKDSAVFPGRLLTLSANRIHSGRVGSSRSNAYRFSDVRLSGSDVHAGAQAIKTKPANPTGFLSRKPQGNTTTGNTVRHKDKFFAIQLAHKCTDISQKGYRVCMQITVG